ncbi:MAG: copper resistance protein CopC [Proteobacteria bacterium]|nr:copper resistance protein CopC [Pseudomonadota bacterium]MDA0927731.1 copper resistance protein CopC [Pseudomonadota bacterium]
MKPYRRLVLVMIVAAVATGCASSPEYSPLIGSEPEIGASLSRAPRTLRLYYNALPDVSRSSLRLTGPAGEHQLRGLHTMAADDLMIEILDPVTTGTYTVEWTTVVGDDPAVYSGSFDFSVVGN